MRYRIDKNNKSDIFTTTSNLTEILDFVVDTNLTYIYWHDIK
jgi:hypothetical protein